LRLVENRLLRRIFVPKNGKVTVDKKLTMGIVMNWETIFVQPCV